MVATRPGGTIPGGWSEHIQSHRLQCNSERTVELQHHAVEQHIPCRHGHQRRRAPRTEQLVQLPEQPRRHPNQFGSTREYPWSLPFDPTRQNRKPRVARSPSHDCTTRHHWRGFCRELGRCACLSSCINACRHHRFGHHGLEDHDTQRTCRRLCVGAICPSKYRGRC